MKGPRSFRIYRPVLVVTPQDKEVIKCPADEFENPPSPDLNQAEATVAL